MYLLPLKEACKASYRRGEYLKMFSFLADIYIYFTQNWHVWKSLGFSSFLLRKKKVHKWKTSRGSHCTFVCACSVFKPFQRLPESFVHHTYALYSPISIKTSIRTHNMQTNTFVPVDSTRREFIRGKIREFITKYLHKSRNVTVRKRKMQLCAQFKLIMNW